MADKALAVEGDTPTYRLEVGRPFRNRWPGRRLRGMDRGAGMLERVEASAQGRGPGGDSHGAPGLAEHSKQFATAARAQCHWPAVPSF
jgi:hypothetical protein